MVYTIGYWKIRGLRTPITLVLEYAGIEYKEEFYEMNKDADGNWARDDWYKCKAELQKSGKLDFANIPYLFDPEHNLNITQMVPIITYLCQKHNVLQPENLQEKAKADMMMGVIGDFRSGFTQMCYFTGDVDSYYTSNLVGENGANWMALFENYFTKNKYCASTLTYADFNFWEIMDHHRIVYGEKLDLAKNYPNVNKFMQMIDDLEAIKNYKASDRWFDHPMNNYVAKVK